MNTTIILVLCAVVAAVPFAEKLLSAQEPWRRKPPPGWRIVSLWIGAAAGASLATTGSPFSAPEFRFDWIVYVVVTAACSVLWAVADALALANDRIARLEADLAATTTIADAIDRGRRRAIGRNRLVLGPYSVYREVRKVADEADARIRVPETSSPPPFAPFPLSRDEYVAYRTAQAVNYFLRTRDNFERYRRTNVAQLPDPSLLPDSFSRAIRGPRYLKIRGSDQPES